MKLVMTLLVRDEADIIRQNLEFHLSRGVDSIVAIDNRSRDGTRDILDEYQRAGAVAVFDEPGDNFAQAHWVTKAALHARDDLAADWIINNDADEFWTVPGGDLRQCLQDSTADVLLCERHNMVFAYDSDAPEHWMTRIRYRIVHPVARPKLRDIYTDPLPVPFFYLDLPPKALVRATGLTHVAQGNHSARFGHEVTEATGRIEVFHFPVRSRQQFESKIVHGGQAYLANRELPETVGWHWRRWYRLYCESGLDAALADALPSAPDLAADLAAGQVIEDTRLRDIAATLGLAPTRDTVP